MTKRTLSLLTMSLLLAACLPSTPPADSGEQSSSEAMMEESSSAGTVMMEPGADGVEDEEDIDVTAGMPVPGSDAEEMIVSSEETAVEVKEDDVVMQSSRVVAVSVDNWNFSPNVITAKKGETVKVRLTGVAGSHGFSVPELGINTTVSAGQTVDVELPTDTAGSFSFRCSVPCGSGHRDMTGTITVSE